ncbi:protein LplB [Clostridia bacterium]|nr:protein LplB [Clostridia bacterium]
MDFNLEKGVPIRRQLWRYRWYYALIIPILAWFVIFAYLPMLGISIAFMDFNPYLGLEGSTFIGMYWFRYLVGNQLFWTALRNSLMINLYNLLCGFCAPIILALLLNECRAVKYKRTVQTISYLPHFISWSIVGGLVYSILSPGTGFINQLIKLMGGTPIYFMGELKYTRGILVASGIWKGVGWGSILYLAALTGINPELYEAATLDGAGKLKQVWHVTLPGISYIITMQLIMNITGFFDVGFEQAYNIVNRATYSTGLVMSLYVFNMGIKSSQFSYATAVGLLQSIVGLILLLMANTATRKLSPEGALF